MIASATTTQTGTPPKAPNLQTEFVTRTAWKQAVLATLNILIAVVAIRFILLTAVAGAIVVAYITIQSPDPWRLGALAVYALTVVGPCVWLASRR